MSRSDDNFFLIQAQSSAECRGGTRYLSIFLSIYLSIYLGVTSNVIVFLPDYLSVCWLNGWPLLGANAPLGPASSPGGLYVCDSVCLMSDVCMSVTF